MFEPRIAKTAVVDMTQTDLACFQVDGEAFPWWLSEEGPSARKIGDDLYLVHVVIFATCTVGDDRQEGFSHGGLPSEGWPQPVLLGEVFPWVIGRDGITYRSSGCEVPSVELEFFAESVEGIEVTDFDMPEDGKIRDCTGLLRRRACVECRSLVAFNWVGPVDGVRELVCPKCGFVRNRSHPNGPLEVLA